MKILVCTDGSNHSKKAMEMAANIVGERGDTHVTVMYVYEKKTVYRGVKVSYMHMTKSEYDSIVKVSKDLGERILKEAKEFFQEKNIPVETILKAGHPAQTIVRVAREEGFDMIIMGSRGMGGLKRMFLGSVSNAVVQEAKTSVLVVKEPLV